jgi:hypothetical protein
MSESEGNIYCIERTRGSTKKSRNASACCVTKLGGTGRRYRYKRVEGGGAGLRGRKERDWFVFRCFICRAAGWRWWWLEEKTC